jgi:hypothetical protein
LKWFSTRGVASAKGGPFSEAAAEGEPVLIETGRLRLGVELRIVSPYLLQSLKLKWFSTRGVAPAKSGSFSEEAAEGEPLLIETGFGLEWNYLSCHRICD